MRTLFDQLSAIYAKFYNPSKHLLTDSNCFLQKKSYFQAIYYPAP